MKKKETDPVALMALQEAEDAALDEEGKRQEDLMSLIAYLKAGGYFIHSAKRNFNEMKVCVSSQRQVRRAGRLMCEPF
jgi:hypothetical protein